MPRKKCVCRQGKCSKCNLCPRCRCKCTDNGPPAGCGCRKRKCPTCKQCSACACRCPRPDPGPRAVRPREEEDDNEAEVAQPRPKRRRTGVVVTARNGGAGAEDTPAAVPAVGAPANELLRYLTAPLPDPPAYGGRARSDPSWKPLIDQCGGARGRIVMGKGRQATSRTVTLLTHLFRAILSATVEEPDAVLPLVVARLQGRAATNRSPGQRTLERVVRSMHRMLRQAGQQRVVRRTVAALACQVPQQQFVQIITGTAARRAVLRKRTNRNNTVHEHQGRGVPLAERVGLGEQARRSANVDRERLEQGVHLAAPKVTRFDAKKVETAVTWLANQADISSHLTLAVRHRGNRVRIPSMLLRQIPSALYTRYSEVIGNASRIGETMFRGIISSMFCVSRGRRTAMDYLSLTMGERNFSVMREYLKANAPDRTGVFELVDQVQQYLEADFPSKVDLTVQPGRRPCAAHHAHTALVKSGVAGEQQTLCADCCVVMDLRQKMLAIGESAQDTAAIGQRLAAMAQAVPEMRRELSGAARGCAELAAEGRLASTALSLASTARRKGREDIEVQLVDLARAATSKDTVKMVEYMRKYQAHLLRGKVQAERCKHLRLGLPANRVHVIMDFKMKFLPVSALAQRASLCTHYMPAVVDSHTMLTRTLGLCVCACVAPATNTGG